MKAHSIYRPDCAGCVLISVEKLPPRPAVVVLPLQRMTIADELDIWVALPHNSNHTIVPSNVLWARQHVHLVQQFQVTERVVVT